MSRAANASNAARTASTFASDTARSMAARLATLRNVLDDGRTLVAKHVRRQRDACAALGSPLYAALLDRVAADVESAGPSWPVLEQFASWPERSAYVLRLMGAVNRLVLTGEAPALVPHFAPGGDGAAAWPPLRALLEERGGQVAELALRNAVQTNEVGRCAALAPALLWASRGLPLRLLEIGTSAGLNLRFDAYRYEALWGPPDSPVHLVDRYEGDPPPFEPEHVRVADRCGCDRDPVDARSEEGRLALLSFVWPDQAERVALLRGALEVAARIPVGLERAAAADWLERVLDEPPTPRVATVVFHSIVWQYIEEDERARIRAAIERAGDR